MELKLKKAIWFFTLLIFPVTMYAQKEVTQFLGIPVDRSKSEMLQKLKGKGFTINPNAKDVLDGEFNGVDVHIIIGTNNNKVRRVAVVDANPTSEENIKIRFNNLLRQFQKNEKYIPTTDSTLLKYIIPDDEDISYELLVNKKAYQMVFYQKTAVYDSLTTEQNAQKDQLDKKQISDILALGEKLIDELDKCFNKKVWVNISQRSGGYAITIFYDNVYNEANGESL